jgi:F-type H+-transporting ATPase subunit a
MPFIALAELISMSIRPATLAIRLATNIIAGHLLLRLLRNQGQLNSTELIKILILLIQALLFLLEAGVSIVQSYVFSTLSLLYLIEANSH